MAKYHPLFQNVYSDKRWDVFSTFWCPLGRGEIVSRNQWSTTMGNPSPSSSTIQHATHFLKTIRVWSCREQQTTLVALALPSSASNTDNHVNRDSMKSWLRCQLLWSGDRRWSQPKPTRSDLWAQSGGPKREGGIQYIFCMCEVLGLILHHRAPRLLSKILGILQLSFPKKWNHLQSKSYSWKNNE